MTTVPVSEMRRETLDQTPERALSFLRALGTNPAIRAIMSAHGYKQKDHQEGWHLVFKVTGYRSDGQTDPVNNIVAEAIRELDAWDEQGFRRAGAALERLHSEQHAYVFSDLQPAQGIHAVISVKKFLDRLDDLEKGEGRKKSRKADQAAIATLAERGITSEERSRLRKLVKIAQSEPDFGPLDPESDMKDKALVDDLVELRKWYRDWSETARAAISRRDYLLLLGLAQRKVGKKKDDESDDSPNNNPTPPAAPVG